MNKMLNKAEKNNVDLVILVDDDQSEIPGPCGRFDAEYQIDAICWTLLVQLS